MQLRHSSGETLQVFPIPPSYPDLLDCFENVNSCCSHAQLTHLSSHELREIAAPQRPSDASMRTSNTMVAKSVSAS